MSGHFKLADKAFSEAKNEAQRWGDRRYAGLIGRDREAFVTIAKQILKARAKVLHLANLRFDPEFSRWRDAILHDAFRVAAARGITYLPLVEEYTGALLPSCALWDTVHSCSGAQLSHPTVTVLLFSPEGQLAIQRRQEADSYDKFDASVTGHQEVGATDVDTAIREAREELDLALQRTQLRRLGGPYAFSKRGSPDISEDMHESARVFRYRRTVCNNERTSVFIAILSDDQVAHMRGVSWLTSRNLRDLASGGARTAGYASGLRQLLHPEVLAEVEDIVARSADPLGIEFFITGSSRSGKASVARRLLESYGGACFDLAIFNRFFAWWVLTQSATGARATSGNAEKFVRAQASHEITIDGDGRILLSGKDITEDNKNEFFRRLESLARELQIEPDGRVFFRGQDVTARLESADVTQQAERQAARTYIHRAPLNRLIWKWIGNLKNRGPVFILGKNRSSAHTAVRAVYLDASPRARADRLPRSRVAATQDTEEHLRQRDQVERTDLQRLRCDVVIDTSAQFLEATAASVGREYEKARLAARMDFSNLRAMCAVPRIEGCRLILLDGPGLLAAADLDYYGWFGAAHGHRLDLLAYFQSVLGDIAQSWKGRLVTWGSDEMVLFFPSVRDEHVAAHLLDSVRREYQARTHRRLGIGKLGDYDAVPAPARTALDSAFGLFVDRYAGEYLFAFEMGAYESIDAACERQVAVINAHLPESEARLKASAGWVVPLSTVSLSGILLDAQLDAVRLDSALDSAFRTLAELKAKGQRNTSVLCEPERPLVTPRLRFGDLSDDVHRALSETSPVRLSEQREEYPLVRRMGALERLFWGWLREKETGTPGFLLCVLPHYYYELAGRRISDFENVAALFGRRDRELLIGISAHYTRQCIQHWTKEHALSIGAYRGRALEGLKPPLQTFWVFEGQVENESLYDLLRAVRERLAKAIPELGVRVLGALALLDGTADGADLLRRLQELVNDASAEGMDREDAVLAVLPSDRRAIEGSGVEARERQQQKSALKRLRKREKELAPWGHGFAAIQLEVVRRLRHAQEQSSGRGVDWQELAIMAALEGLRAWPTAVEVLKGIKDDSATRAFRELVGFLPPEATTAGPETGAIMFDEGLRQRVRGYVQAYGVPFLCVPPLDAASPA